MGRGWPNNVRPGEGIKNKNKNFTTKARMHEILVPSYLGYFPFRVFVVKFFKVIKRQKVSHFSW
jgi:hypothetical protein